MIKPYVITLEQTKAYLGIDDTTYDTQISLYLPTVSDDLCRANGICNQDFLISGEADLDGTDTLSNVLLSDYEWESLYIGAVILIYGEDGVISSIDQDAGTIKLESALTGTSTEELISIRNFPTGSKPVVAQMIAYKISKTSIDAAGSGEVKSRSVGPLSVTFDNGSGTVGLYGYPQSITNGLKNIERPRFC